MLVEETDNKQKIHVLGGEKYHEEEKMVCKGLKNGSKVSTVLYRAFFFFGSFSNNVLKIFFITVTDLFLSTV